MQPVSAHTICTFSCTLALLIPDILSFACYYSLFACQMRVNYIVCMLSHATLLCNINLHLFLFSRLCPNFPVISLYIIHNARLLGTHMHAYIFYLKYRFYPFFLFYNSQFAQKSTLCHRRAFVILYNFCCLFDYLQLIFPGSQADLFCLIQSCLPLNIRIGILKMVMMTVPSRLGRCSPSWLLAIGVAFRQASAQA